MGSSHYDATVYSARVDSHKAAGTSAFTYDADIARGVAARKVHEKLNPATPNKAGNIIRESFDSDLHPVSTPVAVLFDVTGSMSRVPRVFIECLGTLMQTLTKKGYVPGPQVLFGAVGDATCDAAPLQIGQFEAGNEMDEALSKVFLESGGGGGQKESYELGMYYMARHTDLHSVTKRGKKGFLFITGDELPYPKVKRSEVKAFIGDDIQADIPTTEILEELRQKFEVFWIMPKGTSYWGNSHVEDPLREMFGQHFLKLDDPASVSELICATIGLWEGRDIKAVADDMADAGMKATKVTAAVDAVSALAAARNLAGAGTDRVARL